MLFRRALLEAIEGWRLLAPIASTRSMSGFCAAVDTAACVMFVWIVPAATVTSCIGLRISSKALL